MLLSTISLCLPRSDCLLPTAYCLLPTPAYLVRNGPPWSAFNARMWTGATLTFSKTSVVFFRWSAWSSSNDKTICTK